MGHRQEYTIELKIPSGSGDEQIARATATAVARRMGFALERVEALATAIDEACHNAIEHGNRRDEKLSVTIKFRVHATRLVVEITDCGEGFTLPPPPDIEAQLAGRQARRGWGIHLMKNLVDQVDFQVGKSGEHVTFLSLFKNESEHSTEEKKR